MKQWVAQGVRSGHRGFSLLLLSHFFFPVPLHGSSVGCSPFRSVPALPWSTILFFPHSFVSPSSLHSLILSMFPPPHFFLRFHRGTTNFVDWFRGVLWWVCCRVNWNWLCLAWGSPWPLLSEATLEHLCYQTFAIYTQCNSKLWKETSFKASRNKRAKTCANQCKGTTKWKLFFLLYFLILLHLFKQTYFLIKN